ncbi:HEPN domain-containing protein [Abyssalbus ytuae]|uniref:HEPN domain-containing protein n=1 Tax=Abyssalbus ytuae TaxID=2926907 RepID=A0A9E6ZVI1_9FLAO|nr:HEPN domain-containing protein [Abyssalbus ytuae]UOB17566.1 HEPN domain-containing protein [Abyssalbus ytuae]
MENEAKQLFKQAVDTLNRASEELYRPEEDIVTYLVCKNAQVAIESFLKGYLVENGVDISKHTTVNSLYNKCLDINKNFKEIDLSEFNCKSQSLESRYCDDVSKVDSCFKIASNLDSFLRKEKVIS